MSRTRPPSTDKRHGLARVAAALVRAELKQPCSEIDGPFDSLPLKKFTLMHVNKCANKADEC